MGSERVHSAYDRESDSIRLGDLLRSITRRRVLRADLPSPSGPTHRLYARQVSGGFHVLRLNANHALCWSRALSLARLRRLVERGVAHGGQVELGSYESLWPSRYLEG